MTTIATKDREIFTLEIFTLEVFDQEYSFFYGLIQNCAMAA